MSLQSSRQDRCLHVLPCHALLSVQCVICCSMQHHGCQDCSAIPAEHATCDLLLKYEHCDPLLNAEPWMPRSQSSKQGRISHEPGSTWTWTPSLPRWKSSTTPAWCASHEHCAGATGHHFAGLNAWPSARRQVQEESGTADPKESARAVRAVCLMALEVHLHGYLMGVCLPLQKTKPIAIGGMGIIATANCGFGLLLCTLAHALLCSLDCT